MAPRQPVPGQPAPRRPALFERFPKLQDALPFHGICPEPTPVERLTALQSRLAAAHLYVKRDDQTHPRYGGTKVRKLEWLIGDARAHNATGLLTLGAVGSHHVLASAVHGHQAGLPVDAVLFPGPLGGDAYRTARATETMGVRIRWAPSRVALPWSLARERLQSRPGGPRPNRRFIPGGGTSPIGTLGAIDAALELAAQVDAGILPPPAAIFVATGTGGTHAGLAAGVKLAGLHTRVVGVRVVPRLVISARRIRHQANAALQLLKRAGLADDLTIGPADITLLDDFLGEGYGHPTPGSAASVTLLKGLEDLSLEPIYTGKAMSAMIHEVLEHDVFRHEPVLFWHTANAAPTGRLTTAKAGHPTPTGYEAFLRAGQASAHSRAKKHGPDRTHAKP